MKYIKKFESQYDNVSWDQYEIDELEKNNFKFKHYYESLKYESKSEDLYIDIEKCRLVSFTFKFGDLNWKYVVTVIKNGKIKNKKFGKNKFNKALEFILSIIPEVDKEINKYNL